MKPIELERQQIYTWLNKQIKAYKLQHSRISDDSKYDFVWNSSSAADNKSIQVYGIDKIIKTLDVTPALVEWIGNDVCKSNLLELLFFYRGYKFYQLLTPDEVIEHIDFIEEDK